jgi:hypothetical protein
MFKRSFYFLLVVLGAGCGKNKINPACAPQTCTNISASVGILFLDSLGQPTAVDNFRAVNLRTNNNVAPPFAGFGTFVVGNYIIADDAGIQKIAAEGDDIQVSATDPVTGQTKRAIVKIAGGCSCHLSKLAGPDHIRFNQPVETKNVSQPYRKTRQAYLF